MCLWTSCFVLYTMYTVHVHCTCTCTLYVCCPQSSPKPTDEEGVQTNRQLLHSQWSYWTNWYKQQPLGHIRYSTSHVQL